MDIFLTGYPPGTIKYLQVGPITIKVRTIGEESNDKSLTIVSFDGDRMSTELITPHTEIMKYVGDTIPEARNLESTRGAIKSICGDRTKVLEEVRRKLEKSVGDATTNIDAALTNIERKLDYVDRINKVELEEEALRRKTTADSLKYVSPISKLLMDALG